MREIIKYVTFDVTPIVCVRVIEPIDTAEIKRERGKLGMELDEKQLRLLDKKKYPFELQNDVPIHIITNKRIISFTIPKKYIWNGADIPRIFWRVVGSKTDNAFLIASMVHDYLLDNKKDIVVYAKMPIPEYRRLTSLAFREVLKNSGENVIKSNVMAWCVDVYQLCHRKSWQI